MTSVVAPLHAAQPEIIETATTTSLDYEAYQETEFTEGYDNDVEMTDVDPHQLEDKEGPDETFYEEQDTYNAEIESTVVEPPQSDAVLTHAPSTILDEMEYLEEEIIDYDDEGDDQISQKPPPDIQLIQESDTYKVRPSYSRTSADLLKGETTTAPSPPAHSPDDISHLHLFSPA